MQIISHEMILEIYRRTRKERVKNKMARPQTIDYEKARELALQGWNTELIAVELGCSAGTLYNASHLWKPQSVIETQKSKLNAYYKKKIKAYRGLLDKVTDDTVALKNLQIAVGILEKLRAMELSTYDIISDIKSETALQIQLKRLEKDIYRLIDEKGGEQVG